MKINCERNVTGDTTSTLLTVKGTLAMSQAVTRSLAATKSKEWTVCPDRLRASRASPQPKSATTQSFGLQLKKGNLRSVSITWWQQQSASFYFFWRSEMIMSKGLTGHLATWFWKPLWYTSNAWGSSWKSVQAWSLRVVYSCSFKYLKSIFAIHFCTKIRTNDIRYLKCADSSLSLDSSAKDFLGWFFLLMAGVTSLDTSEAGPCLLNMILNLFISMGSLCCFDFLIAAWGFLLLSCWAVEAA